MIENSENLLFKKLIKAFVDSELKFSGVRKHEYFYTVCTSFFLTENLRKTVPPKENQLKSLYETRKRFFKNYSDTARKKDAPAFHSYFYNKFLEEIREERLRVTGVAYSKKSAQYVDKLKNR